MNSDNFGSSRAAIVLASKVSDKPQIRKNVSRHLSHFNRNMQDLLKLENIGLRKRLMLFLVNECSIDVPDDIKSYLLNVKTAVYKKAIEK